jgi:hypothetical protein
MIRFRRFVKPGRWAAAYAVLAMVVSGPAASAQCLKGVANYHAPVYAAPYQAPAYVAPVYEPPVVSQRVIVQEVLAPAYVFQVMSPAYQQSQSTIAQQYPAQNPCPVCPQAAAQTFCSAATPGQNPPAAHPAMPAKVRLDEDQIAEIVRRVRAENDPVPVIGGRPAGTPDAPKSPQPQSPQEQGEIAALQYMGKACASCHQAPNVKGGVTLFDEQGYFKPSRDGQPLSLAAIERSMSSFAMPPGARNDPAKQVPPNVLAGIAHWKAKN